MTHRTIGGQVQVLVIWVGRLYKIAIVTTVAGIRRIVVISVVTGIASIRNGDMSTCERINRVVVKTGWHPGILRVALRTICRQLLNAVIGIRCLVKICGMTAYAGVRRIVVSPVMTSGTVIRNIRMRSFQNIIIIVNGELCGRPARIGGMAHGTIRRHLQCHVIWIAGLVKIIQMASFASGGGSGIPVCMAFVTVYRSMSAG